MSFALIERYTYDDYVKWEGDWELIDGMPLAMAPAPMRIHQQISGEILRYFLNETEECEDCEASMEVDYKIGDETILRPDVVVTCDDDINEAYLSKAPQIVVEVISKSTATRDEHYKFKIYESEGVKYYILVYPDLLMAKLYKLKDGRLIKEGDFDKESYTFTDSKCQVELDFNKIFSKFRK